MQRQLRLRRRQDFARLRRKGRVVHHRLMRVSVLENDLDHNRYGFITAKYLGNAVTRNRLRRVLREAVRKLHPDLTPGFDVIVIARPALTTEPFEVVIRTLDNSLHKSGLKK